jgi:hypothetical protein
MLDTDYALTTHVPARTTAQKGLQKDCSVVDDVAGVLAVCSKRVNNCNRHAPMIFLGSPTVRPCV